MLKMCLGGFYNVTTNGVKYEKCELVEIKCRQSGVYYRFACGLYNFEVSVNDVNNGKIKIK